ncbi:MAG TPA: 5-formyltetrahydrofolate cyclo-ligase [Candidatus Binatia bacterium]|jgi:5-formyltetrahydrofolate cyclo-ligase|nr:5-formyltetrahydrofolate cyclo-ligase [Candidatus Binatia bacterium]
MEENRDVLRGAAISQRNSLSRANCQSWSRAIQAKALRLPQYLAARSVALYSPVQNEVETEAILEDALGVGKQVFFPKLHRRDGAEFVQVISKRDLVAGRFGIAESAGTNVLSLEDCANLAVFIPGVLFDRQGHRLGRGGGWYDRALAQLGNRGFFIGLAYEIQVVDSLPAASWDQRVHYVITENRIIDCGNSM